MFASILLVEVFTVGILGVERDKTVLYLFSCKRKHKKRFFGLEWVIQYRGLSADMPEKLAERALVDNALVCLCLAINSK